MKKKSIEKFGVTEKRFNDKVNNENLLNFYIHPTRNQRKSKASQSKVAFGKSRPNTAKNIIHEIIPQ